MALINCPNCGEKISDKAKFCPHCNNFFNEEYQLDFLEKQIVEISLLKNVTFQKIIEIGLVNKSLIHKTFGNGLINSFENDILLCNFSGTTKKFIFPDVFKGYAEINDSLLKKLLTLFINYTNQLKQVETKYNELKENKKCHSYCYSYNDEDESVDSYYYDPDKDETYINGIRVE